MFFSRVLAGKSDFWSPYLQEQIVNLLDTTFDIPQNFSAKLYKVDEQYDARPDLLAYDVMGDEAYAELICKINGISNPYELVHGEYILLPFLDKTDDFYIVPAEGWKESPFKPTDEKLNMIRPKLKNKTDKRKPNEAIIGNSRYNIDPTSKIVIY